MFDSVQPASSRGGSLNLNAHADGGFSVHYSKETPRLAKDGSRFVYDYVNESYNFDSLDEAVKKFKELLKNK